MTEIQLVAEPQATFDTPSKPPRRWPKRLGKGVLWTFVVLVTAVLWIALWLHWRGLRAWDRAHQLLIDAGEPSTLSEFKFSTVADADNYGTIPALKWIGDWQGEDRSEGPGAALRERLEALKFVPGGENRKRLHIGQAMLGRRTDIAAWSERLGTYFSDSVQLSESTPPAETILAVLEQHDELLAEFTVGLDRPYCRLSPPLVDADFEGLLFSVAMMHLNSMRDLSATLALRATAVAQAESPTPAQREQALNDLRIQIRLTELSINDHLTIGQLIGVLQLGQLSASLWECQERDVFSAEQWQTLQEDFARLDLETSVQQSARMEMVAMLDGLDFIKSHPEMFADSSDYDSDLRLFPFIPRGVVEHNRATIAELNLRFVLEPMKSGGLVAVTELQPDLEEEIIRHKSIFPPDGIMAAIYMPAFQKVYRRLVWSNARTDMSRTACALERFRIANGSYPEKLAQLQPQFVEQLPLDPITGKAMSYSRDQSAAGGYKLWAAGFDGEDGGGVRVLEEGKKKQSTSWLADKEYTGDWVWQVQRE